LRVNSIQISQWFVVFIFGGKLLIIKKIAGKILNKVKNGTLGG
jgi:hypothetical protein